MDPNEIKIQRLINSMYYGVETAFIQMGEKTYRLVGLNGETIIFDGDYRTLRGAKIAFTKFFETRAYKEGIKAEWSHTYPVEGDWLLPKLETCNAYREKQSLAVQM